MTHWNRWTYHIFRAIHPNAAEYTLFECTWNTLQIDAYWVTNQDKKIEIKPGIFSNHNALTLEVNHKKKIRRTTNTWRLKNILPKNEWVHQEIKENF